MRQWTVALAVVFTTCSAGAVTGMFLVGQVTNDSATDASQSVSVRKGEKPRSIRKDERLQLEQDSERRNALGNEIERLQERAADAGEHVSFEELKAQAEAKLFRASASYGQEAPPSYNGKNAYPNPDGMPVQENAPQRVCFRSDGSITTDRNECGDQSIHFGMQSDDMADTEDRYDAPSYDAVSGFMNRQFVPSEPQYGHSPFSGTPQGSGGFPGGGMPQQMTMILKMMDTIMMDKLPKVFAIFEEAGLQIPSESRSAHQKATARFAELKGPCAQGNMESCLQLSEVADIMMGMRPAMEKMIMESGKWEVGMQIGQLMSQGMEGMPMPPGMRGGPPPMMQGGGGYGGPPAGYGNMPEYGGYGNYGGGMPGGYGNTGGY